MCIDPLRPAPNRGCDLPRPFRALSGMDAARVGPRPAGISFGDAFRVSRPADLPHDPPGCGAGCGRYRRCQGRTQGAARQTRQGFLSHSSNRGQNTKWSKGPTSHRATSLPRTRSRLRAESIRGGVEEMVKRVARIARNGRASIGPAVALRRAVLRRASLFCLRVATLVPRAGRNALLLTCVHTAHERRMRLLRPTRLLNIRSALTDANSLFAQQAKVQPCAMPSMSALTRHTQRMPATNFPTEARNP